MEKRIKIDVLEPNAYKALLGLEKTLEQGDLTNTHKDLIRVRASQVNGCAFCIHMHTKEAIKNGETPERLFLLNAWRETDLFTKEEKLILEVTEQITFIHEGGLPGEIYQQAITLFGKNYLSQIVLAVISINSLNRLAITTQKPIQK